MRSLFLVIILNLFLGEFVFSQSTSWKETEKIIGVKTAYGFIISHRPNMGHLQSHVPMFEINFNLPTKGEKSWHALYRYPTMGINYTYANLGNPEMLGSAHALMPYLRFPIIRTKLFEWNYRIALGAAYLTQHFDRVNNIKNIAIGSSFNVAANALFDFHFKLNERFSLSTGIGLTHFSNASFQTPNLGFNIPSISVGAYYQIGKTKPIISSNDSIVTPKRIHTMILGSYSLKGIYPPGSPLYSSYTLSTDMAYCITKKRRIGIGTDWIYDQSLLARAINDTSYTGSLTNSVNFKAGINLSETLVISKLEVSLQMGVYVWRKYNEGQDFYHRFALRYSITPHLIGNLSLRTHFAKADCIEWGLGYKF